MMVIFLFERQPIEISNKFDFEFEYVFIYKYLEGV